MRTSRFILTLLGALVLGSAIAALLLLNGNAQTQIVVPQQGCTVSDLDQDGDCVSGTLDYYPYDSNR